MRGVTSQPRGWTKWYQIIAIQDVWWLDATWKHHHWCFLEFLSVSSLSNITHFHPGDPADGAQTLASPSDPQQPGRKFCCFNGLLIGPTGELACTLCIPPLGTVSYRGTICLEVAEVRTKSSIESCCGDNFCVALGRISSNLELLSGGRWNGFWQ